MKKSFHITKSFVALAVAIIPATVWSTVSPDLTATGSIQLSAPNASFSADDVSGQSSRVNFRAAIRENAGSQINGAGNVTSVKLPKTQRISNKSLLNAAGIDDIKGYSVVLVYEGNMGADPVLYAFKPAKGSTPADIEPIPVSSVGSSIGLSMGFEWIDFVGVYAAGAGTSVTMTATPTASPTAPYKLSSGKLNGFTRYAAILDFEGSNVFMNGVGSFAQTPKGITGRANLSGVTVFD